jgi:hypothetical protein
MSTVRHRPRIGFVRGAISDDLDADRTGTWHLIASDAWRFGHRRGAPRTCTGSTGVCGGLVATAMRGRDVVLLFWTSCNVRSNRLLAVIASVDA